MDVLKEILNWSEKRPLWQQDALRRLVAKGILDQSDYDELLIQCKSIHGLEKRSKIEPLKEEHIPRKNRGIEPITLNSLTHVKGVNALANNQTIKFGKALTIVYGQNAAGKSGYTRVLKKACRARGSEEILGNVLSEKAPNKPLATLSYSVKDVESKWNWTDATTQDAKLANVSVFDRHCATVYLSQKTDVAFRPFGLDLFDKLAACCETLRISLEKERMELSKGQFEISIPEGTKANAMVSNLNALTDFEAIRQLANLSQVELDELKKLKTQVAEISDEDREKKVKSAELRLRRIRTFRVRLQEVIESLSVENMNALEEMQKVIKIKKGEAKKLEAKLISHSHLQGTGSPEWKQMWQAASEFSKISYPRVEFPVVQGDAHCLLCQQELQKSAIERFDSFKNLMSSTIQRELENETEKLESRQIELEEILHLKLSESDALGDINIEDNTIGSELLESIRAFEKAIGTVLESLKSNKAVDPLKIKIDISGILKLENALEETASTFSQRIGKEELKKLQLKLEELEARKALKTNLTNISKEIERVKKLAVYSLCLNDVGTTSITKKSTEITKKVVTEHLISSFQEELDRLGFDHLEIELQPSGASRGALYHKLVIKRASNIEVQSVVSEGEARALSIAAFFAELSTASNQSGILFDDPVSSLDHVWREKVAARLVDEAQVRQVIVFTHDVVFLTALSRIANERKVEVSHQYIHREHQGAGVTSQDLPWVAMRVKDRIGVLRKKMQEARKIEKTEERENYENAAIVIYGFLRETWERALEEVLIGGVIERYRPSIQTLKVKMLADIETTDCDIFDSGMTKCSRWLPGHDSAGAECAPVPNSEELEKDIDTLDNWVKEIHKRRN